MYTNSETFIWPVLWNVIFVFVRDVYFVDFFFFLDYQRTAVECIGFTTMCVFYISIRKLYQKGSSNLYSHIPGFRYQITSTGWYIKDINFFLDFLTSV